MGKNAKMRMNRFMENRIYPDQTWISLYREGDRKRQHPARFLLGECIGTGAGCVAYRAEGEDGIPVKLKQFRPAGIAKKDPRYQGAEDRFLQAYRQQLSMMKEEKTAAVTSGLYGLYQDDSGYYWTSVSGMVGRTLDRILPENSLQKNAEIVRSVAESVKAYHEAGWLLLDVKPENILVIDSLGLHGINFFDFDSFVQASELQHAAEEGRTVLLSSTESYSAPELLSSVIDLSEIGIAADFYSVGALLFTAVFGRRPELMDCLPNYEYDYSSRRNAREDPLSAEARSAITFLLHHTLTLSPAERFETDDHLLQALDDVLKNIDLASPRLSRFMPRAVSSFTGREAELRAVEAAIRSSAAPLVLSGIGGIGKTQLILRLAENLRTDYDFYYVPFHGSVRETLLSLPVENLAIELPDESGVPQKRPDDEVFQEILSCIRNQHGENTVLILDNFDAETDEKTPELQYDPDFAVLCSLPVRLVLTSRCRFDGLRNLPLGELEESAILSMLGEALPDESEDTLLELADTVGRHTLTLSVMARTVRESKGKLTAQKLLQSLRAGTPASDSILDKLKLVFRASALSKTARSVMACAGLFPQRGISSELLITLLTPEQWLTANQLERSGWLRFDAYNNVWSVHPMVRTVCAAEKAVQPNWETVGSFVEALQRMQKTGRLDDLDVNTRQQVEEIFANIGRCALHKPFPWKKLCAGVLLLAAVLTAFLLYGFKRDESPILTITLSANAAAEEDLAHDSALLKTRLERTGFGKISVDEESGEITAHTRLSKLGEMKDLWDTVRLTINRPGRLSVSSEVFGGFYYQPIDRSSIRSAEARFGVIPQVGSEERLQAGLSLNGEYPYLYLVLDEDGTATVKETLEDEGRLSFRLDVETSNYESLVFSLVLPGEETGSFYLLDGRWGSMAVWKTLAANLMEEPLRGSWYFETVLDPVARWEDPAQRSEDASGAFQRGIDTLTDDTVTLYFETNNPDKITDSVYEQAVLAFKRRLDCLQMPYAIGSDFFRQREIVVCIPTEHLPYDVAASILPMTYFSISSSYMHGEDRFFPSSLNDYRAEVEQKEDGSWALVLTLRDDGPYRERGLEEIGILTEAMLEDGDNRIDLKCKTDIKILSAIIDEPITDGRLVFNRIPFLGVERITEEYVPILELLCEIVQSGGGLGNNYYCSYSLGDMSGSSPDTKFGIARNIREGANLLEGISRDFPPAEAWRNATGDSDYIYVSLHEPLADGFAERVAERVEEIYQQYDVEESNVDSFLIYLTDENGEGLCRLSVSKAATYAPSEHRYAIQLLLKGDSFLQYREELEQVFTARPFYTERGFNVRIVK